MSNFAKGYTIGKGGFLKNQYQSLDNTVAEVVDVVAKPVGALRFDWHYLVVILLSVMIVSCTGSKSQQQVEISSALLIHKNLNGSMMLPSSS